MGRVIMGPWFRYHPGAITIVAAGLATAGGLIAAAVPDDRVLGLAMLSLPVALVAVTFGRVGGLASGVVGLALAAFWSIPPLGGGVGAAGWAAAASLLLLGGLVGAAADGLEASDRREHIAEQERARLLEESRRHAEAVEINDLMVQSVAVAKWALESGDERRALELLDDICESGQILVSALVRGTTPVTRVSPGTGPRAPLAFGAAPQGVEPLTP